MLEPKYRELEREEESWIPMLFLRLELTVDDRPTWGPRHVNMSSPFPSASLSLRSLPLSLFSTAGISTPDPRASGTKDRWWGGTTRRQALPLRGAARGEARRGKRDGELRTWGSNVFCFLIFGCKFLHTIFFPNFF